MLYQLEQVSFTYPNSSQPVLKDIELAIEEGELVVILGPSGAGKTTLLQVLGGLLLPTEGEVFFQGKAWTDLSWTRAPRFLFQFPEKHFFETDVFTDLTLSLREIGMSTSQIEQRYQTVLEKFQMDPEALRHRSPFSLSKGEKRKLALASLIVSEPTVLLLDEPVAGLDGKARKELISIIEDLEDTTIVMATQQIDEVYNLAQRFIFLEKGKVILDGKKNELSSLVEKGYADFLPSLMKISLLSSANRDPLLFRGWEMVKENFRKGAIG
jgi:energy-coupling factor transport system ATP-binding protein